MTESTYTGIVCQACQGRLRTIRTSGFRGMIIRLRECINPTCKRRYESRETITKSRGYAINPPVPNEIAASADIEVWNP